MRLLKLTNAKAIDVPAGTLAVELPFGSMPQRLEQLMHHVDDVKDFVCVEWLSERPMPHGYYLEARFTDVTPKKKVTA